MAKKCDGRWKLTLVFDKNPGVDVPDGVVEINKEDMQGVFAGKHTASNAKERPLRKGKCKDLTISFERDHEDDGVIAYTEGVVGEDSLKGKFRIIGGNVADSSEGGRSKYGGKDKKKEKKDKDKDPGDTGTWTGVKEGL
jgi:hypothetical protein